MRLCVIGFVCLLLLPGVTHGQAREGVSAREHYRRGTRAYDLGHYD
jgi:hypothetical protein